MNYIYRNPREALQDIINSDESLKKDLIKECSLINENQNNFKDYVFIKAETLKKITRILLSKFHPDKIAITDIYKWLTEEKIQIVSKEISQIINQAGESMENKSTFSFEITPVYYCFLLDLNPIAFIQNLSSQDKFLKIEEEEDYRFYNWYDDENSYNSFLQNKRNFEKDFNLKLRLELNKKWNEIKNFSRENLEENFLYLYKIFLKKIDKISSLEAEIKEIQSQILEEKNLEIRKNDLEKKERELYNSLALERAQMLSKFDELKLISEKELLKKQEELLEKERILNFKEQKLIEKELILQNKEKILLKTEQDLNIREQNLKEQENKFKEEGLEISRLEQEKELLKDEAFTTIWHIIKEYEEKLSVEKIFSLENLEEIQKWLIYMKDSFYDKLLSKKDDKNIVLKNIEESDFVYFKRFFDIFYDKNVSKNIFLEIEKISFSIKQNFSKEEFENKIINYKNLFSFLNFREKNKAFENFILPILQKIILQKRMNFVKKLRNIKNNDFIYWNYKSVLLEDIESYFENIEELRNLVNVNLFNWKKLFDLKEEFEIIKEIIKKWEIDYLKQYNYFFSKLNDEKWWLTWAFLVDWRNPIEEIIYSLEEKLKLI